MEKLLTIDSATAEELFEASVGQKIGSTYEKIDDIYHGNSRWDERRSVIFSCGLGLYAFDYAFGLTEYQNNTFPWDDDDHVPVYPVRAVPVTTIKYVAVG